MKKGAVSIGDFINSISLSQKMISLVLMLVKKRKVWWRLLKIKKIY